MKANNQVLDELGKKIIEECLDGNIRQIYSLRVKENPPIIFKEKCDFLKSFYLRSVFSPNRLHLYIVYFIR